MAGSFGEALAKGIPVVLTASDGSRVPQVICEPGKECQALETMQKMGLIDLIRPRAGKQPPGTIKVFAEKRDMTDEELLSEAGWIRECISPFEISHQDGSRATGSAAQMVLEVLRQNEENPLPE